MSQSTTTERNLRAQRS